MSRKNVDYDNKFMFFYFYVVPYTNRLIALKLKNTGLNQKSIAKTLKTTEANISQYVKRQRGCREDFFSDEEKKDMDKIADFVVMNIKDNNFYTMMFDQLTVFMKKHNHLEKN